MRINLLVTAAGNEARGPQMESGLRLPQLVVTTNWGYNHNPCGGEVDANSASPNGNMGQDEVQAK